MSEANPNQATRGGAAPGMSSLEGRRRRMRALIPASDQLLDDTSPEASRQLIALLRTALRAERRRGQAGHWTYDVTRHLALRQAFDAEARALADAERRHVRQAVAVRTASDGTFRPETPVVTARREISGGTARSRP